MNKVYTSVLAGLVAVTGIQAQSVTRSKRMACPPLEHPQHSPAQQNERATLWENDFSVPADWTISHAPDSYAGVDWQVGQGLESTGQYGTPAILSTTAGNGYAMLCSDCGNNQTTTYEKCYLTTANPVTALGSTSNVILEFQTQYRRFNNEQAYVAISTDGINFPEPPEDTATVGLPAGLYAVWYDNELTQGVSPGNPTFRRINISDVAGNQANVWVRFYFYGIWGYAWYVDDARIYEQYQYDIGLESAYISHTGTGDEFGRVPATQLSGDLNLGGKVTNFGVNNDDNVVLHLETRNSSNSVVLTHESAPFSLTSAASNFVDDAVAISAWPADTYTTRVWLSSDNSVNQGDAANDTIVRVFEVTENEYSLDGIDVYPTAVVSSSGTNSFTDNPDEMYCLTNYFVEENMDVYAVRVGLSSASVPDALIRASIHDTTNVYADDVSSAFVESDDYVITQQDIDNGYALICMSSPFTLTPGTGYMVGVQLFSNSNATDVRILDDLTIPQPSLSSMIWLANGTPNGSFTNGNAFMIRPISDPTVCNIGIAEHKAPGVSIYPNPTTGPVQLTFSDAGNYSVEVLNSLGEVVRTARMSGNSTMDLGNLAKGVYSVRVSNNEAATVQRVTLN